MEAICERFKKARKISYRDSVMPFILDVLRLLNSTTGINEFNKTFKPEGLYLEVLAHVFFKNPEVLAKINPTSEMLVPMFKKYPLAVFEIQRNHTLNEQLEIISSLKEVNLEYYNGVKDEFMINLEKLEQHCSEFQTSRNKWSVLKYFNSLLGIKFEKISQHFDELPKSKLLVLHVGFNNKADNILYKSQASITSNFLNYKSSKSYMPVEFVHTYESDKCYEVLNEDSKDPEYYICLCYDNNKDIKKCEFSITGRRYTERDIQVLTNNGVLSLFSPLVVDLYFSKLFLKRITVDNTAIENIEERNKEISKYTNYIKTCYDKDVNKCIENWKSKNIDKYFRIFINKLKYCLDENGDLDYNKYVQTINMFIAPEYDD